ncbi:hypothetical protein VTK26DRAFT_3324 [Humicola hyalothermophila]
MSYSALLRPSQTQCPKDWTGLLRGPSQRRHHSRELLPEWLLQLSPSSQPSSRQLAVGSNSELMPPRMTSHPQKPFKRGISARTIPSKIQTVLHEYVA